MKKEYIIIVKKIVLDCIIDENFKVFLFGSRATNTNHCKSDIDIGILGNTSLLINIKF